MNSVYRKNAKTGVCRRGLLILFILLAASPYYAQQAPEIEWQKCFGGNGQCIIQTFDGGFAIAGYIIGDSSVKGFHPSLDTAHPTTDFSIVKLNSSGAIQWEKCLGGSGEDEAYSIIQTSDGGYAIAGKTTSNDGDVSGNNAINGNYDAWIVKLDSSGNIQWQKCFGETNPKQNGNAYAFSIIQNSGGEYVVGGSEIFSNEGCYPGSTDAFVIKLDTSGIILWQKCYGGTNIDEAFSVIQTFDNGYAFAGLTMSNDGEVSGYHVDSTNLYSEDIWVVKLNSYGVLQWQKCLGGYSDDEAYSIVQTDDSGFVIGGFTGSNDGDVSGNHGGNDAWIVKINTSGIIQWQKCLGGKFADGTFSMIKTSDGGFAFAGTTSSDDGDVSGYHPSLDPTLGRTRDIWFVKLNSEGTIQWQKCLGGSGEEEGYSIIETKDGGYAITGYTTSTDGDVSGNHGNGDLWVVKLKGPTNEVASGFFGSDSAPYQIFKIYPNPSSEQVHLQMRGEQTIKNVKFYDLMGRDLTPPYELEGNTATVNVQVLPPGIYIAQLTFTYNDYAGMFRLPLVVQH